MLYCSYGRGLRCHIVTTLPQLRRLVAQRLSQQALRWMQGLDGEKSRGSLPTCWRWVKTTGLRLVVGWYTQSKTAGGLGGCSLPTIIAC